MKYGPGSGPAAAEVPPVSCVWPALYGLLYSTASAGDNKLRVEREEVWLGNPKLHFN